MNRTYIDFEFNRPADLDMGLICCALVVDDGPIEKYWLLDGTDRKKLVSRIDELDRTTFVAYNVDMAEGRCFRALGLDPRQFKWIDLMLDWRWLRNGDDRYSYGDVIAGDGSSVSWSVRPSMKTTKRMTKEEEEEAKRINSAECREESRLRGCPVTNQAAGLGLLDCEYFFGVIDADAVLADKAIKHEIRDGLIVGNRDNPEVLQLNKDRILDYCASDIHLLRSLDSEIGRAMRKVASEEHLFVMDGEVLTCAITKIRTVEEIRHSMGHWAAQLAMYASRGIPLNRAKYGAVKSSVQSIIVDTQMSWNREHPDAPVYRVGPSRLMLGLKKKMLRQSPYVKYEITKDYDLIAAMIDRYCHENYIEWQRTAAGKFSLDSAYLKEMDEKGILEYKDGRIELPMDGKIGYQENTAVLLDNNASCGPGSPEEQNIQAYINLPANLFPERNLVIITAKGDSMEDAGISENDLLFVETAYPPKKGEIVVALDDEGETQVKRLKGFRRSVPILAYENRVKYPDKLCDKRIVAIQGVVRHILKHC